ncbi:hypothetical protein BDR07DRAFT_1405706, partial [Suillus spraguei]
MFAFTYSRPHLLTFLQFTIVHASIITYFLPHKLYPKSPSLLQYISISKDFRVPRLLNPSPSLATEIDSHISCTSI